MLGLFGGKRRVSGEADRRLMLSLARAEEQLIRTHVQNAIDVIEAVAGEMPMGRALELYLDELDVDEPESTIVAQRVLARLNEDEDD